MRQRFDSAAGTLIRMVALLVSISSCGDGSGGAGKEPTVGGAGGGGSGGAGGTGATGGGSGGAACGGTGGAGGGGTSGAGGSAVGGATVNPDGPPSTPARDGGPSETAGPASGGGRWESLRAIPAARQEHGVAAVNGILFVIGGIPPRADRVEAYDPATNSWTEHQPLPLGVDHPSVAGVGDKLYLLGGTQIADVYEYNPFAPEPDRRWVNKMARLPVAVSAAAVGVIGTKVYLAGGRTAASAATTAFQAYDTVSNTWEQLPPLPAARNHVPGAVVDGRFYVIGGRLEGARVQTLPDGGLLNRVDMFDPATGSWSQKAPMPTRRGGASAGVVNGLIVVVGGEGNLPNPPGVFPQTEAYDARTDRWTSLLPMQTPRHGMGAAGVGGKLYVLAGGAAQGGGRQVNTVEAFTP